MVRELELAGLVLNRACEGTALVPEQLRFEQLGWQGGTIDFHERLVASRRDGEESRATSSLPVPLSPRIRTVTSVTAMRSIRSRTVSHRLAVAEEQVTTLRM